MGDEILAVLLLLSTMEGEIPQQSKEIGSNENPPKIHYEVFYHTLGYFPKVKYVHLNPSLSLKIGLCHGKRSLSFNNYFLFPLSHHLSWKEFWISFNINPSLQK
jgi:hypothetical protein